MTFPSHQHRSLRLLFACLCITTQVSSIWAHNYGKIYDTLDSSYYCFRRLNQTHQIGCASDINGNYGIVKLLRDNHQDEDLQFISQTGSDPPYVAVITVRQLANMTLMLAMKAMDSSRLNGVLVFDVGPPEAFSSDRSCPNEYSSLYVNDPNYGHCRSQEAWNMPTADHLRGLMYENFPFPIFLLRNITQIDQMHKKMSEYSASWPKLAVELVSPMHAARDSITCLRRSRMNARFNVYDDVLCDPLGGNNIFHHTIDLSSTTKIPANSMVVLAARLDSFSLFDGLAPGADSAITSLVVTLAIAQMLNQPTPRPKILAAKRSLLYALFDGEAFDYIGSSDTVYSMEKNKFALADPYRISAESLKKYPSLNLTHLSHLIELNQLAQYGHQPKHQIYLHKNLKAGYNLAELIRLVHNSARDLSDLNVNDIADGHPLPPSSAQSFLKKRTEDAENFSVLVATNHQTKYINKYYNSFYEDGATMTSMDTLADRLTSLATLFGRVAYQLVTEEALNPTVKADWTTVRGLLTCFLNDSNCELFQQVQDPAAASVSNFTRPPFNTYVSVYGVRNALREYTQMLLYRFTGEKVAANSSAECQKLAKEAKDKQFNYLWQSGPSKTGECIRSSTYMVPTVTPAIDPETLEVVEANLGQYGLWTESKWQTSSVRIFVLPSTGQKVFTILLGVAVLAVSFVVVFLLNRHGNELFGNAPLTNGVNVIGNGTSTVSADWTPTAAIISEDIIPRAGLNGGSSA